MGQFQIYFQPSRNPYWRPVSLVIITFLYGGRGDGHLSLYGTIKIRTTTLIFANMIVQLADTTELYHQISGTKIWNK